MGVVSKNVDRDKMAVELYFSVLKFKKAEGLPYKDAKDLAYDAVELRYNISPKRLKNIIYENHGSLTCNKDMFIEDNTRLIETLREANHSMQEHIDENNRLIKTLEEIAHV
jgi:hypothetical protein